MKDRDPYSLSTYFTYADFYEVYRRVMPAEEAERMARSTLADPSQDEELLQLQREARRARDADAASREERLGPQGQRPLEHRTIPTVNVSDDTLIMLSLLSPDAESRVDAYRRALLGERLESPEIQREWHERRQEIKAWADAGYPLDPEPE